MIKMCKTSTEMQDKKVRVKLNGRNYHVGIVLGEDPVFKDVIFVGVLETTIPVVLPAKDGKYISVFRASAKQLTLI